MGVPQGTPSTHQNLQIMIRNENIRKVVVYGRGKGSQYAYVCLVYCRHSSVEFSFSDTCFGMPCGPRVAKTALQELNGLIDSPIYYEDARVVPFYRTARTFKELNRPEDWRIR